MPYSKNDASFEDDRIAQVSGNKETGWTIKRDDGWSFGVQADSPVAPQVGMAVRFYGRGMGYTVRGLFLDGQQVFYRTEAEQKEYSAIQTYGADAAEWLRRWDANDGVWSIEMGGLGPGYEQAIQITVAEILRHLLHAKYDIETWADRDTWKRDLDAIEKASFANPTVEAMGLSGAQWGAAMNLATMLYRNGPRSVMEDEQVKDRHIQVRRSFPQSAPDTGRVSA